MSEFQKLITAARSDDLDARWHAVSELPKFGREAETPLVSLLAEAPNWSEQYSIFVALSRVKLSYASSVDTLVGLLNLASHRWAAAKILLHSSPNLRRHTPTIRAILERESEPRLRQVMQKLLDRYPKSSEP